MYMCMTPVKRGDLEFFEMFGKYICLIITLLVKYTTFLLLLKTCTCHILKLHFYKNFEGYIYI